MSNVQFGVSVIICCHNSAGRLPETLLHLAAQKVDKSIPWEVVIIDNASTDDTQVVAREHWSRPSVKLRVVSEPQVGLSHARARGIDSSGFAFLSFIDDDNWVCPQWIQRVHDHFIGNPASALLGGPSLPAFEVAPPDWFYSITAFYAVGKQHEQDGDITNSMGTLLWGAGLSVRKDALKRLWKDGFFFSCSGRKGTRLTGGEDSELCFALRASGWRLHYDSELKMRHFIPEGRLSWSYARRLMKGMGRAAPLLNAYRLGLDGRVKGIALRSRLRESWLFQSVRALRDLIRVFCSLPVTCVKGTEGCNSVLQFDRAIGEFLGYMCLAGRHRGVIRRIRNAAWNKNKRSS